MDRYKKRDKKYLIQLLSENSYGQIVSECIPKSLPKAHFITWNISNGKHYSYFPSELGKGLELL